MRRNKSVFAALVCGFLVALISSAHAEMEKNAVPEGKGVRLLWWPKLSPPPGWQQDRHNSFVYGVNALSPTGQEFEDAEAVIYAKALYKPRVPQYHTLAELIEGDRRDFEQKLPGVRVEESDAAVTADGQRLRSFVFVPRDEGSWERVAYGEEGDYYLVFTLSARTRPAYESALDAFGKTLRAYRK